MEENKPEEGKEPKSEEPKEEKVEEKPKESKPEESEKKEEVKVEKPKRKLIPKLNKKEKVAIIALIIFIILLSIPTFVSKENCEVARAGFKCDTAKNVMIENCDYWGQYSCDTSSDISLYQVEWYIGNLCKIVKTHENIDCSNLKQACNQVTGIQTCPVFG